MNDVRRIAFVSERYLELQEPMCAALVIHSGVRAVALAFRSDHADTV